jgi:hypothetical protein
VMNVHTTITGNENENEGPGSQLRSVPVGSPGVTPATVKWAIGYTPDPNDDTISPTKLSYPADVAFWVVVN